jgi:hypothetical protein
MQPCALGDRFRMRFLPVDDFRFIFAYLSLIWQAQPASVWK